MRSFSQLKKYVQGYKAELPRQIVELAHKEAYRASLEAKRLAPVRTGTLYKEIEPVVTVAGNSVEWGASAGNGASRPYAYVQEYGSVYVQGKFFLTKAVKLARQRFNRRLKKLLKESK